MKGITKNGPFLILIAASCFGVMAFFVKLASKTIPSTEITFFRFFGGLILIYILSKSGKIVLSNVNKKLLITRGILSGIAILCFFGALELIPIGNAVTLNCTYPIFATIFSIIFLKERAALDTVIVLILSFVGAIFVLDPQFRTIGLGDIIGLASGIFAGAIITMVKELRRTENSYSIFIYFCLIGSIMTAPLLLYNPKMPNLETLIYLIVIILLSSIGQLIFAYALKYSKVSEGSINAIAAVLISTLLGHLILKEHYSTNFIIGALIIVGSSSYLSLRPIFNSIKNGIKNQMRG